MATTPTIWNGKTQVNTTDAAAAGGTNAQFNPQVTALKNGGYVVVWVDLSRVYHSDGAAIVGQRYDALGKKVGGEVLLSKLLNGGYEDNAFQPAVTTLSNGNIAVAMVDQSGGSYVDVQIFDPMLTLLRTDNGITSSGSDPELTPLAGGGYVIAYTKPISSSDTDAVFRIVAADGSIGSATKLYGDTFSLSLGAVVHDRQGRPELTTLSNGDFVMVYQDERNQSNDHDVRFAHYTASGGLIYGDLTVGFSPNPSFPSSDEVPDVAALAAGRFVAVWTDEAVDGSGTGIRAVIHSGLNPILKDFKVNTTTFGDQNDATVVALADGGFLVAWDDEGASVVRAKRFDGAGNAIGAEFVLNNFVTVGSSETPIRLALLADGRVVFVGNQLTGSDWDVVTAIWDPRTGPVNGGAASETLTSTPGGTTVNGLGGNDLLVGR
jgi:hypothetical protein